MAHDVYIYFREGVVVILLFFIAGISLIAVVVGVTLHDIRVIRAQRAYKLHPYARKWRARPTIVVTDSDQSASLRRHYRNVQTTAMANDGPTLRIPRAAQLPSGSLHSAVRFHAVYPKRPVPLFPVIAPPATIRQLFWSTYLLLAAPFATMRAGLGVQAHRDFPALQYASATGRHSFTVATWTAKCVYSAFFGYALFLGVVLGQSVLLLAYLAVFGTWSLWAIGRYPSLRFTQKMAFAGLLPATLIYFVWRLATAPLRLPILAAVAYTRARRYDNHTNRIARTSQS